MHEIRFGIWLVGLLSLAFVGLPDRLIAVAMMPDAQHISLLSISSLVAFAWVVLIPVSR